MSSSRLLLTSRNAQSVTNVCIRYLGTVRANSEFFLIRAFNEVARVLLESACPGRPQVAAVAGGYECWAAPDGSANQQIDEQKT